MKIWLLAENWPPRVGGIERYLTGIARHLVTDEIVVIAPFVPEQGIRNEESGTRDLKVERRRFFWPLIWPRWLPLFIWMFRRAKRDRPDIVLCGKALFEGLVGYYLKRYLGIPYIVFTYAMEVEAWRTNPSTSLRVKNLKKVLQNADRVVYINDRTRKSLLDLGVTEKQLVKIWPGINDIEGALPATANRENVRIHRDNPTLAKFKIKPPYVLSVGRLIARKGFDTLVEAFAAIDQVALGDYQLVIAGEGPQREDLLRLAKERWVEKNVILTGSVSEAELEMLYKNADLFVLAPREIDGDFEGFGIVYLEAAAHGLASVATSSGGAAEAVVDKQTGLVVKPDSPSALKEALEYLLKNSAERKKLGEAAWRRVLDQFTWKKRILLVKGMIDAILAEARGRTS